MNSFSFKLQIFFHITSGIFQVYSRDYISDRPLDTELSTFGMWDEFLYRRRILVFSSGYYDL